MEQVQQLVSSNCYAAFHECRDSTIRERYNIRIRDVNGRQGYTLSNVFLQSGSGTDQAWHSDDSLAPSIFSASPNA